jgi:hypothetical protein
MELILRHQCPVRSLSAFEKSEHADDWRELMRLYMVRRTRSFIQDNYATKDPATGRKFLTFEDGTRSFFPQRVAKTAKFRVNERDPADQYARLYAADVVTAVNALNLPRYGLANYVAPTPHKPPSAAEAKTLADLSRAGKRLMGFCRTNLFKRLESGGQAFQQSIERHILRNFVYLHAIEKGLQLPIGAQDAGLLDAGNYDEDIDDESATAELFDDDDGAGKIPKLRAVRTASDSKARAAEVYEQYATQFKSRFRWLWTDLFVPLLAKHLAADAASLIEVLRRCGDWKPEVDAKLNALFALLTKQHASEKVLVFTQFADTVRYLETQLRARGLGRVAGVTGDSDDPTSYAWRFSPQSNQKRAQVAPEDDLRVLIATDVLSEGQNLQDAAIVVNFDLPWAIIRLVQRAGRVDRIGQKAEKILCYSFLPADGVENIICLRARVRQRLHENAEVVGTDEAFFEDERERQTLLEAPARMTAMGNPDLSDLPTTALFCSSNCPGHVILAAHDQAAHWRDEGRCIIGGFHSAVEKDCLSILLRGRQPIIVCPARGLERMRLPTALSKPFADGRLLLLSPFTSADRRVTKELAVQRNRFVAALADEVVFAHITPGGHLDELRRLVAAWAVPHRCLD